MKMFFKKEIDPNPLGVPLGEIQGLLKEINLQSKLVNKGLEVQVESITSVVSVEEPPVKDAPIKDIAAIITIKSYIPDQFKKFTSDPEFLVLANNMASFAALTQDESGTFLGSRLTIYEDETGWAVYFPLLFYSLIYTVYTFNNSIRVLSGQTQSKKEVSAWTDADFDFTKSHLDKLCLCTVGNLGFTAEFGINSEAVSATIGDQTALWRMLATEPHPVLGGGLFCILELPFGFEKQKLKEVVNILNKAEMLPHDLPPHFGSWTVGNRQDNPAYVSFLPNVMHKEAKNIQFNMSIWAHQRVQFANATLLSHGFI